MYSTCFSNQITGYKLLLDTLIKPIISAIARVKSMTYGKTLPALSFLPSLLTSFLLNLKYREA
jgi:hypothetical protein